MKQTIKVRNIELGKGMPKICVSITGTDKQSILMEACSLSELKVDIVEWRVDYFSQTEDVHQVMETAKELRDTLPDMPIIFTFRTQKEGGQKDISTTDYFNLNLAAAKSGLFDFIDIELFITNDEAQIKTIIDTIHHYQGKVILSNHDFKKTPPKEEIINRLNKMLRLNCDLPKIAVMPNTPNDVLELLNATNEMYETYTDKPIVTMSMSKLGLISRLSGELFGSALTFASAKKASAPGQIPVQELRQVLELLHTP